VATIRVIIPISLTPELSADEWGNPIPHPAPIISPYTRSGGDVSYMDSTVLYLPSFQARKQQRPSFVTTGLIIYRILVERRRGRR